VLEAAGFDGGIVCDEHIEPFVGSGIMCCYTLRTSRPDAASFEDGPRRRP
jgi:hypothetical protein